MNLDHYFCFERSNNGKSATRFDLSSLTLPIYEPLYIANHKGQVFVYLTKGAYVKSQKHKPDYCLLTRQGHASGIFLSDHTRPDIGCGDVKWTEDALLLVMSPSKLEVFVAKGQKDFALSLFHLLIDGELDAEMQSLRSQAKPPQSIEKSKAL